MAPRAPYLKLWLVLLALVIVAASAARCASIADRSTILLRYDCASEVGRREITLFANGTIRLREGPKEALVMSLGELAPAELEGFVNRLRQEDLSEVHRRRLGPDGAWVERCQITLSLSGGREESFLFTHYDALPLALSRLLGIAEELGQRVDPSGRAQRLPADYRPHPGDILRRRDGRLFRVVGYTSKDHKAVEVVGEEDPITLFVLADALRQVFVAVVKTGVR